MAKIIEYLRDPAWWFTAVFIAILASIAGGFLKDTILRGMSVLSESFKMRKEKRDVEFAHEVDRIVSNPTLLLLHTARTQFQAIAAFTLMAIYTVLGALYTSVVHNEATHTFTKILLGSATLIFGVGALYTWWKVAPRIRLTKATYLAYRMKLTNREPNKKIQATSNTHATAIACA